MPSVNFTNWSFSSSEQCEIWISVKVQCPHKLIFWFLMFFFVDFKIHGDLSICDHRQIKECLNSSARIKLVNKPFKTHVIEPTHFVKNF